ncbi:MAG: lysylphosphatidylglycerol synthase transmembrane domain-containing protein [Myxococcota bacterium]
MIGIAVCSILYMAGAIWVGFDDIEEVGANFPWWILVPVTGLTLLNYGLRFLKWRYFLHRLQVPMPLGEDAWNFTAGLSMALSPGKAGELLKPYVVRERTGVPMATTIPALISEKLTDGIAVLILAGASVSVAAQDQTLLLAIFCAVTIIGLLVLAHEGLSLWCVRFLGTLPGLRNVSSKLEEMLFALRKCVAPLPLFLTVLVSIVAWGAECIGFQMVLHGLNVDASLEACVFIYAFATLAGIFVPFLADFGLVGVSLVLISGLTQSVALGGAFIIRLCTFWIGVALGAIALFKVSSMLGGIDLDSGGNEE